MSEQRYTPGYVDVPGKGQRYRNARGEYFDNHFGSIANSFNRALSGVGDAYNNYYNSVADAAGTERRDGSVKTPPTPQAPQNAGSSGNIVRMGGKTYNMSDPKQKAAYEAAQKAELDRQRSRNPNGDIRGGDGLKPDGSGRNAPAPNGGGAQGTQTSPRQMTMEDANKLLTGGYTVQNPFSSNQLPATSANPYFDENPAANYNQDLPENMFVQESDLLLTRNAFDTKSGIEYDSETLQYPATGAIEGLKLEGAPLIISSGTFQVTKTNEEAQKPEVNKIPPRPRGERAGEMWDRQYGRMDQSTSTSETKGNGFDMERRRAFLDAPGSMQGLRRVEAQKGIVVAGGQYNMVNPNAGEEGQSDFMRISKEDKDSYMRGDQGAQDLKSKYVDKIIEDNKDTDDEDENK